MEIEAENAVYTLPVLPLKNTVLFPQLFLPLSAGRPGSVAAVEAALAAEDKALVIFTQRDGSKDEISADDLYGIGTRAAIKKVSRADGGVEILVQGLERVAVVRMEQTEPYLKAKVHVLPLPEIITLWTTSRNASSSTWRC